MIGIVTFTRSEVKSLSQFISFRHTDEGFVQELMNLIIFVVSQSQFKHGHDFGQLVNLIQCTNIFNFFRRNRNVDRNSIRDFYDLSIGFPFNTASTQHSTGSIHTYRQFNLGNCRVAALDQEFIFLGITRHSTFNKYIYNSLTINIQFTCFNTNRLHQDAVIFTIVRSEVSRRNLNPDIFFTSFSSNFFLAFTFICFRIEISFTGKYIRFYEYCANSGFDRQVAIRIVSNTTIYFGKNVGSHSFRQIQNYILHGSSALNSSIHFVLLQEHINFLTIRSNQQTGFHSQSKFRFACYKFRNSTFVENVVHKNILMNREGHTNYGVELSHRCILQQSSAVVLKQFTHIIVMLLESLHVTTEFCRISRFIYKQVTKSLTRRLLMQNRSRVLENINTALIQNIAAYISKFTSKRCHLRQYKTIAHRHISAVSSTNRCHGY